MQINLSRSQKNDTIQLLFNMQTRRKITYLYFQISFP